MITFPELQLPSQMQDGAGNTASVEDVIAKVEGGKVPAYSTATLLPNALSQQGLNSNYLSGSTSNFTSADSTGRRFRTAIFKLPAIEVLNKQVIEDVWEGSLDSINGPDEPIKATDFVSRILSVQIPQNMETTSRKPAGGGEVAKVFFWRPLDTLADTPIPLNEGVAMRIKHGFMTVLRQALGRSQVSDVEAETFLRRKREVYFHAFIVFFAVLSGLWLLLPISDTPTMKIGHKDSPQQVSYLRWLFLHRVGYVTIGASAVIYVFVIGLRFRPSFFVHVLLHLIFYAIDVPISFFCKSWIAVYDLTTMRPISVLEAYYTIVMSLSSTISVSAVLVVLSGLAFWDRYLKFKKVVPNGATLEDTPFNVKEFIGCWILAVWLITNFAVCQIFTHFFNEINSSGTSNLINIAMSTVFSMALAFSQFLGVLLSMKLFSTGFFSNAFWAVLVSELFYFSFFRNLFTHIEELPNMFALALGRYLFDDLIRFVIPLSTISFRLLKYFGFIDPSTALRSYRRELMWRIELHFLIGISSIAVYVINLALLHRTWNGRFFNLVEDSDLKKLYIFHAIVFTFEILHWIMLRYLSVYICEARVNFGQMLKKENRLHLTIIFISTMHVYQDPYFAMLRITDGFK
ncbi:hypothetical protein HDU67_006580 [Dinochytrium kinnereticum]|nr:hypothetical protein HDU67_006580 [Dinochytrium kinnereticum]